MSFFSRKTTSRIGFADRIIELSRYSEIKRMVYRVTALQKQKGFRSLAILSVYPGEGKTLLCAALAMAYAETCQSKVLVVDATTRQNPKSLNLREGLDLSMSGIEFISLGDMRRRPIEESSTPVSRDIIARSILSDAKDVSESPQLALLPAESDQALILKGTEDGEGQYGLILLDTVPLSVQNKGNIDPLLVAHTAEASLLVVGQRLLGAADLNASLKIFSDPTLHLIGMISNEDYQP